VASNIVRVHGGRITVDSHVGDGTAFTVVLPTIGSSASSATP